MEMEKSEKQQRLHLSEELARYVIERTKESCKGDSKEFFYKEVLLSFAPCIFTKRDASEAMVLMEKLLK